MSAGTAGLLPLGFVTFTAPVVVPAVGVTATIVLSSTTAIEAAGFPLKVTAVAPRMFVPEIVTAVPACLLAGPFVGSRPVIVGAPVVTTNGAALIAVPTGFVTVIEPAPAPLGTFAVIFVSVIVGDDAATPLNFTEVVPVKPEPRIVTLVPTLPLPGEKDEIAGVWKTVKDAVLVPVSP
jgi:hypothetical protein